MNFYSALEAVNDLYGCLKQLSRDRKVMQIIDNHTDLAPLKDFPIKGLDPCIATLCIVDLIKGFENLGHRFNLRRDESKILGLFLIRVNAPKENTLWDNEENFQVVVQRGLPITAFHAFKDNVKIGYAPERLLLVDMLRGEGADERLLNNLVMSLFRLLLLVAEADNCMTMTERMWLGELVSFSSDPSHHEEARECVKGLEVPENNTEPSDEWCDRKEKTDEEKRQAPDGNEDVEKAPLDKLRELVGLENVKNEVQNIYNLVKIGKLRKEKGLKSADISYHCVFTGNPGTGKTTVARILADVYKELGILKKGHLVETDRSGLVAEYVGQTAVKTNKIIDSALDGVLFIDEAYTLANNGANDFGPEAIATLLKRMEDDRGRLVVVIAGYCDEIKSFIDSNPGLQSRFNRYIHFDDYTAEELFEIFSSNLEKYGYHMDARAAGRLREVIGEALEHKDRHFGNGRYVRNLFEKTLENQARRLVTMPGPDENALNEIKSEDL